MKAGSDESVRAVFDNTKTVVGEGASAGATAQSRLPEYAETRGFVIDATRLRTPPDKARVERAVRTVTTERYDAPPWSEPKLHRDQHAQVAKALYLLPRTLLGKRPVARADRSAVRFYHREVLVQRRALGAPCSSFGTPRHTLSPPPYTSGATRERCSARHSPSPSHPSCFRS